MPDQIPYDLSSLRNPKGIDNGDGSFSLATALQKALPAGTNNIGDVGLTPDARNGKLSGGTWTLGSASIVDSIAVPDWARGFRLRPSADLRFAVNEDPVASGAEVLTVGNTAYSGETETRLLEAGAGRTLRLLGTSAGMTVGVGFF